MSIEDPVDDQLARLLGQNARQSSESLAKQLKISAATVRRRIRRLLSSDSLRIVGVVDPTKFEPELSAVIILDIVIDKLGSAMELLVKRPEIKWASITTGRFNIVALSRFHSSNELSEFTKDVLAKIEGVKNSETFVCLDIGAKEHYMPLAPPFSSEY